MKQSQKIQAIAAYIEEPLTVKEEKFVENVVLYGMTAAAAARHAQCQPTVAYKPTVIAAIAAMRAENAAKMEVTRDKVLNGLQDAIERARVMGEPLTEIAGWREVAKVAGLYDSKPAGKDLTDKQKHFLDKISEMSDEELTMLTAKPVGALIDGRSGKTEKAS